jgi:hypothetical protein
MNSEATILDRFLDPLTECLTVEVAQRIVALCPDTETLVRLEELREQANEGQLSEAEQAEYEEMIESIDFVGILKAKAREFLARSDS